MSFTAVLLMPNAFGRSRERLEIRDGGAVAVEVGERQSLERRQVLNLPAVADRQVADATAVQRRQIRDIGPADVENGDRQPLQRRQVGEPSATEIGTAAVEPIEVGEARRGAMLTSDSLWTVTRSTLSPSISALSDSGSSPGLSSASLSFTASTCSAAGWVRISSIHSSRAARAGSCSRQKFAADLWPIVSRAHCDRSCFRMASLR